MTIDLFRYDLSDVPVILIFCIFSYKDKWISGIVVEL